LTTKPSQQPSGLDVTVCQDTVADLDTFLDILDEATQWLASRGIDQWQGGFSRARGTLAISRGEMYLASIDGKAAGILLLQTSDEAIWGPDQRDALYVHALAVHRAFAGRGVGVALLRWAEEQVVACGRRWLRLDCMAANSALRHYYQEAGFTLRGEVRSRVWAACLFERDALGQSPSNG